VERGLLPEKGERERIHLTTHPEVALLEAIRTVEGEPYLKDGYKQSVGGDPLIVIVDRARVSGLKLDIGYYDRKDEHEWQYRPSEIRLAFITSNPISCEALAFIEANHEAECRNLLQEIEGLASRPTFGSAIRVDFRRRRTFYGRGYIDEQAMGTIEEQIRRMQPNPSTPT
jgi:hypothetical protein